MGILVAMCDKAGSPGLCCQKSSRLRGPSGELGAGDLPCGFSQCNSNKVASIATSSSFPPSITWCVLCCVLHNYSDVNVGVCVIDLSLICGGGGRGVGGPDRVTGYRARLRLTDMAVITFMVTLLWTSSFTSKKQTDTHASTIHLHILELSLFLKRSLFAKFSFI